MKRKNRKRARIHRVHGKKRPRIARANKNSGKHHRERRKKIIAVSRRRAITDPRIARALGSMRREGVSASAAAGRERMKLKTFRKGAGKYLYRPRPGKPYKARSEDDLAFSMQVLTIRGPEDVIVRKSRERKLLHEYNLALRMFRAAEDGAEAELKKFEGKTVGGHVLVTDFNLLIQLEEADQIDAETFYTEIGARS